MVVRTYCDNCGVKFKEKEDPTIKLSDGKHFFEGDICNKCLRVFYKQLTGRKW